MSKRPTATNPVAAKHWSIAIEPITSVANGQATDATSEIVPGWLPPVEPELVRSSRPDLSRVTTPTLPPVDAELVRSTNDESFASTTDCRDTVESEVINDSNGDADGVAIEALPPVEAETVSPCDTEPAAATVEALPLTEPETVSAPTTEPAPATVEALPLTEPETVSAPATEPAPATVEALPLVEPETASTPTTEPAAATVESLPLTKPETVSAPTTEPAAATVESLPLVEAEAASTPTTEPAATVAESLPLTEPQVRSSIAALSAKQIVAPTTEWSTKKPLGRSRDFESTNGYRHLTLLANEEARLVFQTAPNGLAAEQFRLLRRTLTREYESGAVLLITSPAMGDGKTLTSVNLASCLAESGQPTLLVEADIRRPTMRKILSAGVEPPGVEDVLARNVEPRRAVHGIKELNLYAAMVTRIPDNPAQLISGPGVKDFLAWARENFLWVVLDAPPTLPAADVSELLPFVDAALLVIRAQSTPRELAKQAVEILGRHLRGVVFNEVTVNSNPHYRYLNNYYYSQTTDSKSGGRHLVKRTKSE